MTPFIISHLRRLCDTFAFPRALRVTEAAARLHAATGLHLQVETQNDLRGCGGTNAQHTYHKKVRKLRKPETHFSCS